jgi:hypothetical protein
MSNAEPKSPLTIIAIFAGIIEASALASLPFLSEGSQTTYTWFLVGFPFFLTVLFFLTLNFNYKSLYSPPVTDSTPSLTPTISTKSPTLLDTSVTDVIPAPLAVENPPKTINVSTDNDITPVHSIEIPVQPEQATVTITLSGTRGHELLEQFALHALNQTQTVGNTWVICNLQTGTRITLETLAIDR